MPELTKVLLVDDNSKYLKDALPLYGYEVTTAYDGVQALKELSNKSKKFDIVLLDVMMPNMNGWQTLISQDLLTSKEKEVLEMVANGASNKQIADKLFVKEVTVKTHLNSIFKKLKVANRTQAVLVAGYLHEN